MTLCAADGLGQSPKTAFYLHKALDKVLRKVGARERSQSSHPVAVSVGTEAALSDHASRRSSLGSMGLPEHVGLHEPLPSAEAPSSRHTVLPGWQVKPASQPPALM